MASAEREAFIEQFSRTDPRWWHLDPSAENEEDAKADSWKRTMRVVRVLDEALQDDKMRMARCARIYDPNSSMLGVQYELRTGPYPASSTAPVTMNVVKSAVDTVTAMIAQHQVRAAFTTDGADWSTAMKAKDMELAIEGEFQRVDLYAYVPEIFRDSCMVGQGVCRPFEDQFTNKPEMKVIPWDCLIIDRAEWAGGSRGRQIHEVYFIDKSLLMEMYPDKAEIIARDARRDLSRYWTSWRMVDSDMVPIVMSWHLRSSPDSDDGVYAVNMDGVNLEWEKYEEDDFPHEILYWNTRPGSFFGCGLIEEVAGMQNRVNKINGHIARCHDLSNTYVVCQAIDAAIRVKQSGGSNPLQVLPYRGTAPPSFETPAAVPPELYQHLVYMIGMIYKLAGVSELSAQSEKPENIDSAIGMQTFIDIESKRFAIQQQRMERFVRNLAVRFLKILKAVAIREGTEPQSVWRQGNVVKRIDFRKVNLDEDQYVISIQPASLLTQTPGGKLTQVVQMGNTGLFDRKELRKLIGHPDLERASYLDNASEDHAERIIERMTHGDYRPPDVLDDIPTCLPYVAAAYKRLDDGNAPEKILSLFRDWITAGSEEMARADQEQAAKMAPPPGPPGMPPPAGPMGGPQPLMVAPPTPPQMQLPPGMH